MIKVNALGDACPLPVVKTKNAIKELSCSGIVEVLVDNEIAVQNLTKMANQKGYEIKAEKLEAKKFQVVITVGDANEKTPANKDASKTAEETAAAPCYIPDSRDNIVVAVSSAFMGEGSKELGRILLKGFLFALTQQDVLPKTLLFYNGGASLTCENSASLEDLKFLEAEGVEILTCGTCLNYYGLTDSLKVGEVTNMYTIVEKLTQADKIIKP